ncbi:DUF3147 family protein [Bradyrhizobium sp.]|uniref:DUF3147 family protein n=1 Tax=Bradyrhizobium sp. TaxID=376 RepID=UPI0025BC96AA|nr:DUF3147 family protein [Bradyrhizobium sp.]
MEYVARFLIGGFVVSAFALLGDLLRPKSFAGLFGAAPSVALATLGIAVITHGASYAAQESRAMVLGAIALTAYSIVVCQLLMRTGIGALKATSLAFVVWLLVAFGLQMLAGAA